MLNPGRSTACASILRTIRPVSRFICGLPRGPWVFLSRPTSAYENNIVPMVINQRVLTVDQRSKVDALNGMWATQPKN